MRPLNLYQYLPVLFVPGTQAVVLNFAACAAACTGTAAGWDSFCGSTTASAVALGVAWWTPTCYGAGLAFRTPAGQRACQIACNSLAGALMVWIPKNTLNIVVIYR